MLGWEEKDGSGQKKSCQDFALRASLTTVPPYLKIK